MIKYILAIMITLFITGCHKDSHQHTYAKWEEVHVVNPSYGDIYLVLKRKCLKCGFIETTKSDGKYK